LENAKPRNAKTTTLQGTTETGRAREIRRKEVEEDLNIMGIETDSQWSDTFGNDGIFWTPVSETLHSASE
jgi:hypothetical protein